MTGPLPGAGARLLRLQNRAFAAAESALVPFAAREPCTSCRLLLSCHPGGPGLLIDWLHRAGVRLDQPGCLLAFPAALLP